MEHFSSDYSEDDLMHYGRKGMKWYQRIFSKDSGGSGKKSRTDNGEDPANGAKSSSNVSNASSSSTSQKSAKDMSETELMSAIRHLQLEDQYRRLQQQQAAELNPQQVSKGKQFVSDFTSKAAVPAVQEAGKQLIREGLVKLGKKALGLDEKSSDSAYDSLKKEVDILDLKRKKAVAENYLNDQKKKAESEKNQAEKDKTEVKKTDADKPQTEVKKTDADKPQAEVKKSEEPAKDPRDKFNYYFDSGKSKTTDNLNVDISKVDKKTISTGKSYVDSVLEAAALKYEQEKPWYK